MALNYLTVDENDFSYGIDSRSAENQIQPGFVRDLLNADIIERRPRQRTGYQGYAGNLPVRVRSFEYNNANNQICFNLDSSIDLGSTRSSPIIVYGRSSSIAAGGPFTTAGDEVRYYPGFTVPLRKTMVETAGAPPYETIDIPAEEHGIATSDMFIGVAEATSTVNRSYQTALPNDAIIDLATNDITIEYQNSTGEDKPVFVYYEDKQPATGSVYIATLNHTGSGVESFSIGPGTHGLSNFNIIGQIQEDKGADVAVIKPDSFVIESDGTVTIDINTISATTYYAILSTTEITNQVTGNVSGSTAGSIVITDLTSPWIFYGIYLEVTPGGDLELVYPDSITYDDSTATATLSFTNNVASARKFICYYDYGTTRSNQLCVEDVTVSVDDSDTRPQLSIWGLDHSEIYGDTADTRAGWATHIDSYRSAGEQRIITGLGGNLFSARTSSEVGTSYLYPTLYGNLRARTDAAMVLGPLFWDTGDTPARSRGYITSDSSGTNWGTVTSVEYDSGNGWTKYTISLPNKQIFDSTGTPTALSNVISVTATLEDWLSVQNMSYSRHNGVFRIKQVTDGTDEIFVWVENDTNSVDYDDLNTGGEAGVFTDQFTWLSTANFLPGDILQNAALGDTFVCNVLGSIGTTTVVDGVIALLEVAGGLTTTAQRTSSVIPLRTNQPAATSSVTNLVRGDMLSYTGIDRLLRINYINADSDRTIDITGDGTTATATLASGDTSYLSVGTSVVLTQAGVYTGAQVVTGIPTPTTFTFDSTETDTALSATLLGNTIEIDESLTWEDTTDDSITFSVGERWIPIEAPDDSFDLTPSTYPRHLDSEQYDNQSFLRSTMVQNNMYLTNGEDEVFKFDGTNIYRAGLFPWQPGLFITQDTAATATIEPISRQITWSGSPAATDSAAGQLPISDSFINSIPSGSLVLLEGDTEAYTVREYIEGTTSYIKFDRAISSSVIASNGTITEQAVFRYYFRLNAVDANDNIIASAVTGYQDHVVQMGTPAAINIKLVGLPAWDIYDYDTLEVEIYRTKQSTFAPFYKITTLPMQFNNTEGYIEYSDSFADSDLIDLDIVNTALLGQEIGISWQQPLRSKYITSIGNSLVLGNISDYPQIDLQIIASGAVTDTVYAGKIFTLRRSNTDTGNTTSMPDRARYEFVETSGATPVTGASGNAGVDFTITVANSAATGDWVYLFWSTVDTSGRPLKYAGWWQIASATGSDITINFSDADGTISTPPDSALFATDPTDIPVPLGVDGNMGMVNGDSFDLFDVGRRLSMAINATMRMVDVSISGMEDFQPWIVARGGNDVGKAGRVIIRRPRIDSATPELELPSSFTDGTNSFQVFVNSIRRDPEDQISASTRVFRSRILVSYENYPEIFDNPTAVLDTESDSAIDINSADGQEITGILPFFGEAAFGAAQQSSVLVVFKTNSIYLVDINEKRQGRNSLQRIETEGLGCTAPYSLAVTKNGIMFANESGIYCLRKDQSIEYIGEYMERNWTEQVDLSQLAIAQGHHYGLGRSYKLSIPLVGDTSNSEVYVYNHTGEKTKGRGSWTRYDNHPATGWANLTSNAFFGSTLGRVFSLRNTGTETDFRDDSSPITFRLDTRPMDFGNSNIRKVLDKVLINYRVITRNTATTVSVSVDLSDNFDETTPPVIPKPTGSTGMDDDAAQAVVQILHNTSKRRGSYFQIRVENSALDQNLEVAGIGCRIGGLTSQGILEAQESRSK